MANKAVNSMTAATTLALTDILYKVISPFGVGDDRKITVADFIAAIQPSGAGDPNGVVTALFAGQWYIQINGGAVTPWNATVAGGTTWV